MLMNRSDICYWRRIMKRKRESVNLVLNGERKILCGSERV